MSRKNHDTPEMDLAPINDAAPVAPTLDDDLEPLPEIRAVGTISPLAGTYRDSSGNPLQGPGIPEGRSGRFFVHHAGDFTESAKEAWIAEQQRKGFARAPKVTVDGYPDAVVMWTWYEAWKQRRAEATRDTGPINDGFTTTNWSNTRVTE